MGAARLDPKLVARKRRDDPGFKAREDAAFESGVRALVDDLAEEARRRAMDGVTKDIYYQGNAIGQVTEYSDPLLMFLLKSYDKRTFGDRMDHVSTDKSMSPAPAVVLETDSEVFKEIRKLAKKVLKDDGDD
jgi:hypothetical protein